MTTFSLPLKVINERNCPFYEVDDWFVVSGQSVQMPAGHPTCLILARELTSMLFKVMAEGDTALDSAGAEVHTCGGCTGLIKFKVEEPPEAGVGQDVKAQDASIGQGEGEASGKTRPVGTALSGMLEEISPSELLQFFHMHQKTGKLMLHMPEGTGRVAFREGAIIGARLEDKENKDAIFALLAANAGRFNFVPGIPPTLQVVEEIGDFMMLLMEGIKRLDEGSEED